MRILLKGEIYKCSNRKLFMENPFELSHPWNWYLEMEDRFKDYLRYVPLVEDHFNVWSLKLGFLTHEICSLLDSLFEYSSNYSLFTEESEFNSTDFPSVMKSIKKKKRYMKDWKTIFNTYYSLHEKELLVKPMESRIKPFEEWETDDTLKWWSNYNKIKHHRFISLEKATLKTTLYALGAFFLVIILHVPHKKYLYDIDIIKYESDLYLESSYRCADMLLRKEPIIIRDNSTVYASTSLFFYEYQKHNPTIPNPSYPVGGVLRWPSDNLWPDCQEECVGRFYRECYRSHL